MFSPFIRKYGKQVIIPVILVVSGIFYFYQQSIPVQNEPVIAPVMSPTVEEPEMLVTESEPSTVVIDVKGAVHYPGVYTLTDAQRIVDAIEAAGGYTEDANPQLLNNAQRLQDEMVIYVPKQGEELPAIEPIYAQSTADKNDGRVNLNTADVNELMTLPGIGQSKAATIIAYREEHGPFQRVEDLLNVSGIGQKTFEKLQPSLIVK